MKTIYDLELHEELKIRELFYATRVPGGWLYENVNDEGIVVTSTFVRFHNEFQ